MHEQNTAKLTKNLHSPMRSIAHLFVYSRVGVHVSVDARVCICASEMELVAWTTLHMRFCNPCQLLIGTCHIAQLLRC